MSLAQFITLIYKIGTELTNKVEVFKLNIKKMYQISRLDEEICNNELVSINNKLYSVNLEQISCTSNVMIVLTVYFLGFTQGFLFKMQQLKCLQLRY